MKNIFAQTALAALVVGVIATKGDAQTVSDTKNLAGGSGFTTWCSFTPWFASPVEGVWGGFGAGPPSHSATDHCTLVYPLPRDHVTGPLPTVTVHAVQDGSGTWPAYTAGVSCALDAFEFGTTPSDSALQLEGAWAGIAYDPNRPSGTVVTFTVPKPALQPLGSGHQGTFPGSPASIRCDIGNSFLITDVTYNESGAD